MCDATIGDSRMTSGPAGWFPDPWRPAQSRYFDGVRWTEHIARHDAPGSDERPPMDAQLSTGSNAHAPISQFGEPTTQNSTGSEVHSFPLGERVLVLRSVPSRMDMRLACTIEDAAGRQLGSIRSINASRWQRFNRFLSGKSASYEFEFVRGDGTPLMYIKRPFTWRDGERFEVRDGHGREIGLLQQNNSYHASHRHFAIEHVGRSLAYTKLTDKPLQVIIYDHTDRVIARLVKKQCVSYFWGNDFYDYTLTFEYAPDEMLGYLCLVVGLAEYFYYRIENGGPMRIPYSFRT